MSEAIPSAIGGREDAPVVSETLTRLRAALDAAAAIRSGAEILHGWYKAVRNPEVAIGGLTLVQWSALLPDSGQLAFEDATLSDADHAAYAALLRPAGNSGPIDFAAAAEAGLDLLFAAETDAEVNRAHAVLALAAIRMADRARAREPQLALAILERAAGRKEIASDLIAPLEEDGVLPYMRFPKRMKGVRWPSLHDRLRVGWIGLTEAGDGAIPSEPASAASQPADDTVRWGIDDQAPRPRKRDRPVQPRGRGAKTTEPVESEFLRERVEPVKRTGPEVRSSHRPAPAPAATPFGGDMPDRGPQVEGTGTVLFNPPDRMRVGTQERIEIRLGDADTSVEVLKERLRGKGVPQTEIIEITSRMRVRLIGDPEDFDIRALSHEDQLLRATKPACWDFDVTPKRAGQRVLRLLVSLRVRVEGRDEVVDLPALERDIAITVSPWFATRRFLAEHWKWFVTALFIPVLGWLGSKVFAYLFG